MTSQGWVANQPPPEQPASEGQPANANPEMIGDGNYQPRTRVCTCGGSHL
jgi:hypothetical protein